MIFVSLSYSSVDPIHGKSSTFTVRITDSGRFNIYAGE